MAILLNSVKKTHSGSGQAESAVGGSGRIVAMLLRIIYYTEVFICCVGIYMLSIKKGGLMSGGLMSGGLMSGGLMSGGLMSGGLMSGGLMSGGLMSGGLKSGGLKSYDRWRAGGGGGVGAGAGRGQAWGRPEIGRDGPGTGQR